MAVCTTGESRISATTWLRSCFGCGRREKPQTFSPCADCDAVLFCDSTCRSSSDHSDWCRYFKIYMRFEDVLTDFPFLFSHETTDRMYHVFKNRDFLLKSKVYGKGLWKYACRLCMASQMNNGTGVLKSNCADAYVLEKESAILMHPPEKGHPSLDILLTDWASYYSHRGFGLDSPIAGVLHYALTLYTIIVSYLPQLYPHVFKKMTVDKKLCVHIIGAAKEADMMQTFLECSRLLPSINLHLIFIGEEISPYVDKSGRTEENLSTNCYAGLYHDLISNKIFPECHIAVCFNAGLGAYESYKPTVQYLTVNKIPTFCTDYCLASYEQSKRTVRTQKVADVSLPMLNPFRSPFRMVYTDTNLPRFSNGLLFTIIPYSSMESQEPRENLKCKDTTVYTQLNCAI